MMGHWYIDNTKVDPTDAESWRESLERVQMTEFQNHKIGELSGRTKHTFSRAFCLAHAREPLQLNLFGRSWKTEKRWLSWLSCRDTIWPHSPCLGCRCSDQSSVVNQPGETITRKENLLLPSGMTKQSPITTVDKPTRKAIMAVSDQFITWFCTFYCNLISLIGPDRGQCFWLGLSVRFCPFTRLLRALIESGFAHAMMPGVLTYILKILRVGAFLSLN